MWIILGIIFISLLTGLNRIITIKIDDKTKFNPKVKTDISIAELYYESGYEFFMLFFAIFIFPFKKQIRKWRKINYIKHRKKSLVVFKVIMDSKDVKKERKYLDRSLKLEKLK